MKLKTKLILLGALDLIERQSRRTRSSVHADSLDTAGLDFKEMLNTVRAAQDAMESMDEVVESVKKK